MTTYDEYYLLYIDIKCSIKTMLVHQSITPNMLKIVFYNYSFFLIVHLR